MAATVLAASALRAMSISSTSSDLAIIGLSHAMTGLSFIFTRLLSVTTFAISTTSVSELSPFGFCRKFRYFIHCCPMNVLGLMNSRLFNYKENNRFPG